MENQTSYPDHILEGLKSLSSRVSFNSIEQIDWFKGIKVNPENRDNEPETFVPLATAEYTRYIEDVLLG